MTPTLAWAPAYVRWPTAGMNPAPLPAQTLAPGEKTLREIANLAMDRYADGDDAAFGELYEYGGGTVLNGFEINSATGTYDAKPAPYSVAVDPSGHFVWVGEDNPSLVTVFARDPATGLLTKLPDITVPATGLQPEVVFAPYPAKQDARD